MSLESVLEQVAAIERMLTPTAPALSSASQSAAQTGGAAAPPTGEGTFAQALSQASEESQGATDAGSELPATGYPAAGMAGDAPSSLYAAPAPYGAYTGAPGAAPSLASSPILGAQSSYAVSPLLQSGGTMAAAPDATAGQRIVAIAESQIGQAEQPPGSNESPAIARYRTATAGAMPGEPWCAYFASWAAHEAGDPIGAQGQGLGAVSEIWSWAQSAGRAVSNGPGVTPKPGDLIVFGDEHVGIVKDVLPDGDIQTIEGNYDNQVYANVRTPTEATGYVEMS